MKFNNVRLLAQDYAACFRFYTQLLGLEAAWGDEHSGYAFFRVAESIEGLALYSSDAMAQAVGNSNLPAPAQCREKMMVVLSVDNVDHSYEQLLARGAVFINPPHDMPGWGSRVAHLRDPEGNLIELFAPLPKEQWAVDLKAEDEKY